MCKKCVDGLSYNEDMVCEKCGKPISENAKLCRDCEKGGHKFTKARSVWVLEGEIREALYRFKFNNRRDYAKFFSYEAVKRTGEWIREINPDAIVAVPMHKKAVRVRGYNQSLVLAREISKLTGIKTDEKLIIKVKNTLPQKGLSARDRKNNLKNAFKLNRNDVQLKSILIVDDIYTTGSTADAVAEILNNAGVGNVYVLCMCTGRVHKAGYMQNIDD